MRSRLPHDPSKPRKALRIALASFGSPSWGTASPSSLYLFLHRLRTLLRQSSASAILTFPAHLYRPSHASLITRLEHASDGVIELESFASSPLSLAAFPRHNGILRIPKLPSIGGLVPPSAKLSVLRGMGGEGGMENNLGFRVKRRRFIIETVNGDDPVGPEEKKVVVKEEKKEVVVMVKDELEGELRPNKVRETKVRAPPSKPVSIAAIMHKTPELYEF